jgi:putative MFS transporter
MSTVWKALQKLHHARLSKREWRILAIVSTAGIFADYDGELINLALPQIQQSLQLASTALAPLVSVIKLGTLMAAFLTVQADRFGRRRLLMLTIVGYTIFTGLTAFAWSGWSFVGFRVGASLFSSAEGSIALVMLIEEMATERRGMAVGLLGALSALGFAMAALAYAWIEVVPMGWRGLYMFALIPLVVIIPLRKFLPESIRFEQQAPHLRERRIWGPFQALIHSYPTRFGVVALAMTLTTFAGTPGGLFQSLYLEQTHHWSPAKVSLLVGVGGSIGIFGNIASGFLSDHFGRRHIGAFFLFAAPLLGITFYNTSGGVMAAAWILALFANTAASTVLNTYSVELFSTSHRATATSSLTVVNTVGGVLGLLAEPLVLQLTGSTWQAVSVIYLVALGAPIVVLFMFPETAHKALEELSPERYEPHAVRMHWHDEKAGTS